MNAEELMETSGVTSLLVHLENLIAKPRTGEGEQGQLRKERICMRPIKRSSLSGELTDKENGEVGGHGHKESFYCSTGSVIFLVCMYLMIGKGQIAQKDHIG